MRIVETDNHGGDYPDETFINLPRTSQECAEKICNVINDCFCQNDYALRFWKVVPDDYKLIGGFKP